jgi:rhodanese-related sulfurtransferase
MKKFLRFAILFLMLPAFVLTSCKDDDDDVIPERQTDAEFQILSTYLQANSLDLSDILTAWNIAAADLNTDIDDYYVIDIRSAEHFNENHIIGATNSTLSGILTAADGLDDKPIVVACYSGQTAGHAVAALRLSGYADAKVLLWGMSGWHTTLDSWSGATNTISSANWIASPGSIVEHTTEYNDPDITETGDGAAILAARVTSLLSGSLRGVTGAAVLEAPGSYFINNFWDAENVAEYGNISGAYRIKPLTLAGEEYKYLDPSKDVVTYCWTGQTSSVITAYLYILGYDSFSLKNGSNSMIYDNLTAHKWSATGITDLPMKSELP